MKLKTLNIKLTPVKIAEVIIFLLIPLVYYFLIGGFKDISPEIKNNKPYEPLSEIKIDFVNGILSGKYDKVLLNLPARKTLSDTMSIYKMANAQRIVIYPAITPDYDSASYFFGTVNGYTERTDNGKEVRYFSSGNYVDNKRNLEKCYAMQNIRGKIPLALKHDTTGSLEWYFKPRMKIRTADFSPGDTRPVVALVIYDQSGNRKDSTVIRVRNFSDLNGKYDGSFTEYYLTESEMPGHSLRISSEKLFSKNKYDRFDVSIFWFGEIDLWFEKLIIDDNMANHLFLGNYMQLIKDGNGISEFLSIADMLKQKKFTPVNYTAVNYVMNLLYGNLQNINIP